MNSTYLSFNTSIILLCYFKSELKTELFLVYIILVPLLLVHIDVIDVVEHLDSIRWAEIHYSFLPKHVK